VSRLAAWVLVADKHQCRITACGALFLVVGWWESRRLDRLFALWPRSSGPRIAQRGCWRANSDL